MHDVARQGNPGVRNQFEANVAAVVDHEPAVPLPCGRWASPRWWRQRHREERRVGNINSIIEARRRVRQKQDQANAARAQQDQLDRDDIAKLLMARTNLNEVAQWRSERRKAVLAQVDTEAEKKCENYRAIAKAAFARMQARGQTMATIAELSDLTVNGVRSLVRWAPKPAARKANSRALGKDAVGDQSDAQTDDPTPPEHDVAVAVNQ